MRNSIKQLDYSENAYLQDKDKIFSSIRDLVSRLSVHYRKETAFLSEEQKTEIVTANWRSLGASEEDIAFLMEKKLDSKEYSEIKQYDAAFQVSDYVDAMKKGWNITVIQLFFQEGIAYAEIKEAFSLGIKELKYYREAFKPKNLKFADYLDAYRNNIIDPVEYIEFKKGYKKDFLIFGGGGVADSMPLATADFFFLLWTVGWEHYFTKFQRGSCKISSEAGLNFMSLILPSPYLQMNTYFGFYPLYAKASAGVLGEVFLGMHFGVFGRGTRTSGFRTSVLFSS